MFQAVTEQDAVCKKKVKKKKQKQCIDEDVEKALPMDAVEIPAASTDGTESVTSNHHNANTLNTTMETTTDSVPTIEDDENASQQSQLSNDDDDDSYLEPYDSKNEKEMENGSQNGTNLFIDTNEENAPHCDSLVDDHLHDQDVSPLSMSSRTKNKSFETSDEGNLIVSGMNNLIDEEEDTKKQSSFQPSNNLVFRMNPAAESSPVQPGIEPVGSKDESVGEELGDLCSPVTLRNPLPLIHRNSLATVTSEYTYDDDSTADDHLCPICLCGYQSGDILIESKHCTHLFHKGTWGKEAYCIFMSKIYALINLSFCL